MPKITLELTDDGLNLSEVKCEPPLPVNLAMGHLEAAKLTLGRVHSKEPPLVTPAAPSAVRLLGRNE